MVLYTIMYCDESRLFHGSSTSVRLRRYQRLGNSASIATHFLRLTLTLHIAHFKISDPLDMATSGNPEVGKPAPKFDCLSVVDGRFKSKASTLHNLSPHIADLNMQESPSTRTPTPVIGSSWSSFPKPGPSSARLRSRPSAPGWKSSYTTARVLSSSPAQTTSIPFEPGMPPRRWRAVSAASTFHSSATRTISLAATMAS